MEHNWLKCPPKDPNRLLQTSDIYQRPRKLLNKPNFNLNVSDIEGAQPRPEKSNLGKRKVNPLNPEYKWSTVTVPEPETAKFQRDSMDVSDIWGAQPSRCITYACKQRNNMNYKDIDRSYAGWNTQKYKRTNNAKYDQLNVADINSDHIGLNRLRGNRCTNPLEPQYEYDASQKTGLLTAGSGTNENAKKNILGAVKGSKHRICHKNLNRDSYNLRTNDIDGARVEYGKWKRNVPRNPMDISDIEKCGPSSKVGIVTKRCTNPLNPNYNLLDYKPTTRSNSLQRNQSTLTTGTETPNPNTTASSKSANRSNQGSSNLTKKNIISKYERQQQVNQMQDDIQSVRSLED